MAFCNNCGVQLQEGKKFCVSCGHAVAADTPPGQSQQQHTWQQQPPQPPPQQQQQYGGQGFQQGAARAVQFVQNTADETSGFDPADIQKNKVMGGLAYFLFFLPLIACPESKYGRFHANQSLVYLITSVVGGIAMGILSMIIGVISWRLLWIASILSLVFWLAVMAEGIIGLINGFSGKAKELPIIGKFRMIK